MSDTQMEEVRPAVDLSDKHFLFLFGPGGSGKNHLTRCLIKAGVKLHHLSTGDKLREFIRESNGSRAKEAKQIMSAGHHVPIDIVVEASFENLNSIHEDLIIIDGFPRNEIQAEYLLNCKDFNLNPDNFMGIHIGRSLTRCLNQIFSSSDRGERDDDEYQSIVDRYNLHRSKTVSAINIMRSSGMHLYETGDVDDLDALVPFIMHSHNLERFVPKSEMTHPGFEPSGLYCANFLL